MEMQQLCGSVLVNYRVERVCFHGLFPLCCASRHCHSETWRFGKAAAVAEYTWRLTTGVSCLVKIHVINLFVHNNEGFVFLRKAWLFICWAVVSWWTASTAMRMDSSCSHTCLQKTLGRYFLEMRSLDWSPTTFSQLSRKNFGLDFVFSWIRDCDLSPPRYKGEPVWLLLLQTLWEQVFPVLDPFVHWQRWTQGEKL